MMPDETPPPPQASDPVARSSAAQPSAPSEPAANSTSGAQEPPGDLSQPPTRFEIGEEFGTAKKNLPPTKIILIGVGIIIVVFGILAVVQRPKSHATGSIDDAVAAEIPGQNSVMAAINLSIENEGKEPFKIHNIKVDLETNGGNFSDEPASAVDLDRYFQALPELKKRAMDPLLGETVIPPGGTLRGTIVVSFPIAPDAFASRKSLKVTVWPYRSTVPLILVK
jgi:hypothetical protein